MEGVVYDRGSSVVLPRERLRRASLDDSAARLEKSGMRDTVVVVEKARRVV